MMKLLDRRTFLAGTMGAAAPLAAAEDPWGAAAAILGRIREPRFPARDFPVVRHGADPDGKKDSTAALRKAIAACHAAGGGRVVVPAGRFLTGALHLKSNVNLHLEEGAHLLFSRDPNAYLPVVHTRWEGVELMGYSALIYAFEQENIAVTGKGTLDGQAGPGHWWPWKGRANFGWKKGDPHQQPARTRLFEMAEKDEPVSRRVFGEGSFLRPQFVQPYRSRNVLIEGVTIVNSPMWEIHPVLCRNVIVRGVRIATHGPNNDGCDPESSADVLIEDCVFDTGDDCIAIKSGRNRDGRRLNTPCENLIIRGCQMKDGHGGVTIGSEISGGVRNVFAEKCRMDSPNLDRALRIKTNSVRGGVIEQIHLRDIDVGQVAGAAIDVDFYYEEGEGGAFPPTVRDVTVERMRCRKSERALHLRGYAASPIRGLRLTDCVFENAAKPDRLDHVEQLVQHNVTVNGQRR